MRQTESPVNLDTVHLYVPCGRYELMHNVHQYPYYPTVYPYAGTIAGDSRRQSATQTPETWGLRRRTTMRDNRVKRICKPQVVGSSPTVGSPPNPEMKRPRTHMARGRFAVFGHLTA